MSKQKLIVGISGASGIMSGIRMLEAYVHRMWKRIWL